MIGKAKRAQYTLEFKLEAVRLVKNGQSMAAVAATLGETGLFVRTLPQHRTHGPKTVGGARRGVLSRF